MNINDFWNELKIYEGETFYTMKGLPFTYTFVSDNIIRTDRANQTLSKGNFETAIQLLPVNGPGDLAADVRGSSYVYSLLMDQRLQ